MTDDPFSMSAEERRAMHARRAAELEARERHARRRARGVLALVLACFAVGCGLVALSMRLSGDTSTAVFWGGVVVGNAGAFYSWYFLHHGRSG